MEIRSLLTGLLATVIAAACVSPTGRSAISPSPDALTQTRHPVPTGTGSIFATRAAATQLASLIEPYQYRYGKAEDLTALNRALGRDILETLWFTQTARWWSSADKEIAQDLLKLGMNPGLGIRQLHAEGITGKGIRVAIIDQPVIVNHPEFEGKIIKYRDMGTGEFSDRGSMHGPAVTSLLVGNQIGTAPGAQVYFVAVPSWLLDARYYADAVDWIIAENAGLPQKDRIRVISASSIPSGIWSEYTGNQDAWDAAHERARAAGILVLDCTYEHGYTVPCTRDLYDPDDVAKCIPEWGGPTDSPHPRINIPTSQRSTAIERNQEPVFSYQYTGRGGLSWSVPYLAGVLAMGWQINPRLTGDQLLEMVFASAYRTDGPAGIIDPEAFIERVRNTIRE